METEHPNSYDVYDVDNALLLTRFTLISYMDADGRGSCKPTLDHLTPEVDFEGGIRATCRTGAGRPDKPMQLLHFSSIKETDTQAFICETMDHSEVNLVVRGTNDLEDWINNFDFRRAKWDFDFDFDIKRSSTCWSKKLIPMVHNGFYQCFLSIRTLVDEMLDLIANPSCITVNICGHSLGGAIAQLAFIYLLQKVDMKDIINRRVRINFVGFGQPRTGDRAWILYCEHITKHLMDEKLLHVHRVFDNIDMVPGMLPFFMGYRHFGQPCSYLQERSKKILMVGYVCTERHLELRRHHGDTDEKLSQLHGGANKMKKRLKVGNKKAKFTMNTTFLYDQISLMSDNCIYSYYESAKAVVTRYLQHQDTMKGNIRAENEERRGFQDFICCAEP